MQLITLRDSIRCGFLLPGIVLLFIGCGNVLTKLSPDPADAWEQIKHNFNHEHYLTANEQLKIFTLANSSFAKIDSAHYLLALTHEHLKEFILAANAYERLIRDYPNSSLADEAQYGIAESYYRQSPVSGLAQENTETALVEYQILLEEYPNSEKRKQAEERIYELRSKMGQKDYDAARLYHRQKYYKPAVIYYNFVLTNYYDTKWGDEALFYVGECHFHLEHYTDALESFGEFLRRYPEHEFTGQAQQYVKELRRLLDAEAQKVLSGSASPTNEQ